MAADESEPKEGGTGLERIIFFSDAVFAIAITLLVLDLKVPAIPKPLISSRLGLALRDLWPGYVSYVISFLVIGAFWAAHHRIFRYIKRHDGLLIALNTLLLMCVAFLPFPTGVLGAYGGTPIAAVLYAAILTATSCFLLLIWWHACRGLRLVARDIDPMLVRAHTIRAGATVLIFLLSIPAASVNPSVAELCWLLTFFVPRLIARVLE